MYDCICDMKEGRPGDVAWWSTPRNMSKTWIIKLCPALGPDNSVGGRSPVSSSTPSNIHFLWVWVSKESSLRNQGRTSLKYLSGSHKFFTLRRRDLSSPRATEIVFKCCVMRWMAISSPNTPIIKVSFIVTRIVSRIFDSAKFNTCRTEIEFFFVYKCRNLVCTSLLDFGIVL